MYLLFCYNYGLEDNICGNCEKRENFQTTSKKEETSGCYFSVNRSGYRGCQKYF